MNVPSHKNWITGHHKITKLIDDSSNSSFNPDRNPETPLLQNREIDIFKDFYMSPAKDKPFKDRMGRDKSVKLEVTRKNKTVRKVPFNAIATPFDQKLKKHET